jgi:hypothetical protein
MMNHCIAIASLALVPLRMFAQQDSVPTWRVSAEMLQLFFVNANASVERAVPYGYHGVLLAYRPSLREGSEVGGIQGQFGGYTTQNSWNWLYQSFTVGSTNTFWLSRDQSEFIRIDALYRHWWFNDKMASYDNVEGYRFDGLRTERQDVFALKVLYGPTLKRKLGKGKRNWLIIESYCGLGIRWSTARFRTHYGIVGDLPRQEYVETFRSIEPSLHTGFRMGLGWGRH